MLPVLILYKYGQSIVNLIITLRCTLHYSISFEPTLLPREPNPPFTKNMPPLSGLLR